MTGLKARAKARDRARARKGGIHNEGPKYYVTGELVSLSLEDMTVRRALLKGLVWRCVRLTIIRGVWRRRDGISFHIFSPLGQYRPIEKEREESTVSSLWWSRRALVCSQ